MLVKSVKAVRNFWIDVSVDGREFPLVGGPRSKDGGMTIKLYQRDDGGISDVLTIECREVNGELTTKVYNDLDLVFENKTER